VTGRDWTPRQPDGTAVRDLPLAGRTLRLLHAAGVLTLGQLRAMSDRELLGLARFGPVALADVRYLVPAPGGGQRETGSEVTIAGRVFRLGTVYAPRRGSYARRPRRLLGYSADSVLPGGRVTVAILPSGDERTMTGKDWAAWAGEPVEEVGS
jgi:hypothetical protein